MRLDSMFRACVDIIKIDNGGVEIACKYGLWSVSGNDYDWVECEAKKYWWLFYQDGEYARILDE